MTVPSLQLTAWPYQVVAAAALTAYDPRVDGDGGIAAAARTIAARIARAPRTSA
jgi:hypothetical protein